MSEQETSIDSQAELRETMLEQKKFIELCMSAGRQAALKNFGQAIREFELASKLKPDSRLVAISLAAALSQHDPSELSQYKALTQLHRALDKHEEAGMTDLVIRGMIDKIEATFN